MKNFVKSFAILMAVSCVFACKKTENDPVNQEIEKYIKIEKVPMTFSVGTTAKTILKDNNEIWFHKADSISIFDGNGQDNNNKFYNELKNVTDCEEYQASVNFVGEAGKVDTYYALYPYQKDAILSDGNITDVSLPGTQNAVLGTFDPKANLSADVSTGQILELKNVCSLFKIVVAKGERYNSAVITNNDGSPICGTFSISFDDKGLPVVNNVTGSPSVTLTGVMGSDDDETIYYAVILPGTYSRGINVKLYKEGQETAFASRSSSSPIDISRAKIATFGHIKPDLLSGEFSVSASKKVKFSKGNLWCDASTGTGENWKWAFEENQWDAPTKTSDYTQYDPHHVCHFFPTKYGTTTTDTVGYGAGTLDPGGWGIYTRTNWGQVFGDDYWQTPYYGTGTEFYGENTDSNEMRYLLVKRQGVSPSSWVRATIEGVLGALLFPDEFSWDTDTMGNTPDSRDGVINEITKEHFAKIENAGGVFLPFAGQRIASNIQYGNNIANIGVYGYYNYSNPSYVALQLQNWDGNTNYVGLNTNTGAYSVRLYHVVNK